MTKPTKFWDKKRKNPKPNAHDIELFRQRSMTKKKKSEQSEHIGLLSLLATIGMILIAAPISIILFPHNQGKEILLTFGAFSFFSGIFIFWLVFEIRDWGEIE